MPTLDCNGGPLDYDVIDITPPWITDPETVLFCHGVATDRGIWAGWLPGLTDRFRIVRFDTRGFGRSHVPGPGFGWSMDLLADDILAVAEATKSGQFHLVGESLGGTVSLYLASRSPTTLLSVTAVSTSHRGGSIRKAAAWRDFVAASGMEEWSRDMMADRFLPDAVPDDIWRWFHGVQCATSPDSLLDLADLLIGSDYSDALANIEAPALLLAPDSSPFVSTDITADMHRLIPKSEIQVFPGARHGLACSHGVECSFALLDFLARYDLA
jgi:3-oxoadipate enol-lactonase